MTGAVDHVPNMLPDSIVAAVQQVIGDSRSLGLTWTLRLASVSEIDPPKVILDGDTEPLVAVSMIGTLFPLQRVYILTVPPSGNFIVGFASFGVRPGRLVVQAFDTANSALVGAETVMLTTAITEFRPGITYRFEVMASLFGQGDIGLYRLRRNDLAGSVIWGGYGIPLSFVYGYPGQIFGYISNTGTSSIVTAIALTVQPAGGFVNVQQIILNGFRNLVITEAATSTEIRAPQI